MKARTKLIATIMAMCLVVTLGVFGILAVKTLNMSVGGNITFTADGISFEVSAGEFKTTSGSEYTGITTQTGKLQAFAMNTNTKLADVQDKINSWAGLELFMDNQGDAVLHFDITNKMSTDLYVYIETNLGTNLNENMGILVSSSDTQIQAGQTKAFAITFDILDMNINAKLTGFNVVISFAKESQPLLRPQYKYDETTGLPTTEIDYFYVVMGTHNGQPVKWRYIADIDGNPYDGTSIVSELKGYFILETECVADTFYVTPEHLEFGARCHEWRDDIYKDILVKDYALSDIRSYLLNGFLSELNILPTDEIYSKITARKVSDLYSKILEGGEDISELCYDLYAVSVEGADSVANQQDKLWLLSEFELTSFFASEQERAWTSSYWLRSPLAEGSLMMPQYVFGVGEDGAYLSEGAWCGDNYGVRPCFKIA